MKAVEASVVAVDKVRDDIEKLETALTSQDKSLRKEISDQGKSLRKELIKAKA